MVVLILLLAMTFCIALLGILLIVLATSLAPVRATKRRFQVYSDMRKIKEQVEGA